MNNVKKTEAKTLRGYRVLIFNSTQPKIADALQKIGIDKEYLAGGKALYESCMALVTTQKENAQSKKEAFTIMHTKKQVAMDTYQRTYKMLNLKANGDNALKQRMSLKSLHRLSINVFIDSAIDAYTRILTEKEFLASIQKHISEKQITAEFNNLKKLLDQRNITYQQDGEAQESTRLKKSGIQQLSAFCLELKGMAKLALAPQPQLLEKLGIIVS
jgi:hypothetical protein